MVDKQQLAAMGEHMREMEEYKQKKHGATQVMAWAGDYEKIGGHGLIVEMLKSYAGMLSSSHGGPEFKVPDGWKLVPVKITDSMFDAALDCADACGGFPEIWGEMLAAAPEYKP